MKRRQLIQLAFSLSLAALSGSGRAFAASVQSPRWVILNWGLTEMALSLGIVPVGIAAPLWYRRLFSAPSLPADVADVGLLYQPNYETLRDLKPTLLVITPGHLMAKAQLQQIAPLLVLETDSEQPLALAKSNLQKMAAALSQPQRAEQVIASVNQRLARARQAAQPFIKTPLYLARPVDSLHLYLFGAGSLFHDVLNELGLTNANQLPVGAMGATLITVDSLATSAPGRVVLLPAYPQTDVTTEITSRLWQSLPMLQAKNLLTLPDGLSENGGLITAARFAEYLVQALQQGNQQQGGNL
ncbi:ABC transporter substrate-binding protein [Rouxiella sp. Mn2063]|uniref:ABC transporter substrate-binding protein n=1 Tax=Rouxiella sp. Mn2063 TaxID=3395262 RepID=UPI003BEBE2AA